MAAPVAANPHNQLFSVGTQIGGFGIAILIAMWLAPYRYVRVKKYRGAGDLATVLQNIADSMFNSHLFDFTHGWLYVVGVGIVGGTVMREAVRAKET